ncbi:hypothetical protein POM88_019340 [Heracleum sosnowskyi]|uniref:Uncharacterized protein n=1 Tax=Heracleum sosnowskyi TaxID=360622 RepID=A0AAD8IS67_9APIA|nr:hypothetical protein POM88_019340 [Heracleum sosnowskyi]
MVTCLDSMMMRQGPSNLKTADLVVNGTLIETKLSIYRKTGDEAPEKLKETSILEILAGGGKVHVVRCEGDLTVKVKLHSLKIKDKLQASSNLSPQYLACSVQKDDCSLASLTKRRAFTRYVDSQMIVSILKLEFYFNRPTLVALIGFGLDPSTANGGPSVTDEEKNLNKESSENKLKIEEYGNTSVKGLLGYGKGRVVFYLNMNVDSVIVYLNSEDGSQIAMFVQERSDLDLKVHPSSISIEGTLGNLILGDLTLGSEHYWAWLCYIRNQGAEFLIQFEFHSYSAEDDDYEGYDYSLQCRLSAVRIVFLYRFVQEVSSTIPVVRSKYSFQI